MKFFNKRHETVLYNILLNLSRNIFFYKDKFYGFIDFYFSSTDFYAYELATWVNALCFDKKYNKFVLNKKKTSKLIKGYESKRKLTKNIKGKVIFVNWVAKKNFSGSDLKPGAIKDTNKGINNSITSTIDNRKIVNRLKISFAKFSDFFFPFISSFE